MVDYISVANFLSVEFSFGLLSVDVKLCQACGAVKVFFFACGAVKVTCLRGRESFLCLRGRESFFFACEAVRVFFACGAVKVFFACGVVKFSLPAGP